MVSIAISFMSIKFLFIMTILTYGKVCIILTVLAVSKFYISFDRKYDIISDKHCLRHIRLTGLTGPVLYILYVQTINPADGMPSFSNVTCGQLNLLPIITISSYRRIAERNVS